MKKSAENPPELLNCTTRSQLSSPNPRPALPRPKSVTIPITAPELPKPHLHYPKKRLPIKKNPTTSRRQKFHPLKIADRPNCLRPFNLQFEIYNA
jgi:hypothetical protein